MIKIKQLQPTDVTFSTRWRKSAFPERSVSVNDSGKKSKRYWGPDVIAKRGNSSEEIAGRWQSKSLKKQPTFGDATTGFPAKWHLRKKRRDSTLMTHHYLQSWTKVLGHLCVSRRFPIHTGPTPSLTPQTVLDACIQNFFRVSALYRVGGGRTARKFRKALF